MKCQSAHPSITELYVKTSGGGPSAFICSTMSSAGRHLDNGPTKLQHWSDLNRNGQLQTTVKVRHAFQRISGTSNRIRDRLLALATDGDATRSEAKRISAAANFTNLPATPQAAAAALSACLFLGRPCWLILSIKSRATSHSPHL